ncbi:Dihydrolipoyl dehydrogenase [Fundidesulfovibrio magnetotacticus]|uniref:Dihydrolipoyl dehydrogenase n=1 Tax=Fundidesulfovibrio magnetotacticus TaxID=2730080 RepID=A0A6V8LJ43_9BACT|nr:FAD-dependent oxidoreductase [Fundidesulfovibrio magnetotacticus]GFK92743.1 Dihydrolipoyl dehydrogenase [Fundidesulfovibrio magnetotacticus]
METELFIVGGGPAGYDAALAAARRGIKAILLEKEHLGGSCLNWGCIPTKFLLAAVAPLAEMEGQERLKVASGQYRVDLPALADRKKRHIEATRKAMAAQLEKLGVTLLRGELKMIGAVKSVVEIEGEPKTVSYKRCILATGSRPAAKPGLKADHDAVLNSGDILGLREVPESLVVIGAGFIGLELAQFFSRMGSAVTLLEVAERIAPAEDEEVSKALAQSFKRQGWAMHTGVRVASLATVDGQARVELEDGRVITAAKCLLAVGRQPNSRNLMLEMLGAEVKGAGWVHTDEHLLASPTVYAVGDVNGRTLLAHAASSQGEWAVRHFAGEETRPYEPGPIPGCMYGAPETMRVGLLEAEARAQGLEDVTVTRAQLIANPIAQAHGATGGLVKCVWSEGRLKGVTAVGHGVASLATLSTVLVGQGFTRKQCEDVVFPHPTLDEALRAALLA